MARPRFGYPIHFVVTSPLVKRCRQRSYGRLLLPSQHDWHLKSSSWLRISSQLPLTMMMMLLTATMATSISPTAMEEVEQEDNEPNKAKRRTMDDTPCKTCGPWCLRARRHDPAQTKCRMDESIMPCASTYCQTTCQLWNDNILKQPKPKLTCDAYKNGQGFPRGGVPCDDGCLPLELRRQRYPAPTGLGLLCKPGTCQPAGTMTDFQCPCNWFGAPCRGDDDWFSITRIRAGRTFGSTQQVFLLAVDKNDEDKKEDVDGHQKSNKNSSSSPSCCQKLFQNAQPGSVWRIIQYDSKTNVQREAAAAVVVPPPLTAAAELSSLSLDDSDDCCCELEILLGPPNESLLPEVTQVHRDLMEKCRRQDSSNSSSTLRDENLYVTPAISGFINQQHTSLVDYLLDSNGSTLR